MPDVLAPALSCVFCGINPGRVSAAAAAHFANPRNDFWRLLGDAGFTPRRFEPSEQFALLELGYGLTNAAYRTTPGSSDLRRGDFARARIERMARELAPRAIAFVGKEAYRGLFGGRPELGPQPGELVDSGLYVLPSTSPANAAVPFAERLRWFRALREWLEPVPRETARALVVDVAARVLLLRWELGESAWWITPGGGIAEGEDDEAALRRELAEELGLGDVEPGPLVYEREHVLPLGRRLVRQHERYYLVRVEALEPVPAIDLSAEHLHGHRWWAIDELRATGERFSPPNLADLLETAVSRGQSPGHGR